MRYILEFFLLCRGQGQREEESEAKEGGGFARTGGGVGRTVVARVSAGQGWGLNIFFRGRNLSSSLNMGRQRRGFCGKCAEISTGKFAEISTNMFGPAKTYKFDPS